MSDARKDKFTVFELLREALSRALLLTSKPKTRVNMADVFGVFLFHSLGSSTRRADWPIDLR